MPPARKNVRPLDVDTDDFDIEVVGAQPAPIRPGDPAAAAARLLVSAALAGAGISVEDAGRDGVVFVIRAPADWSELVRDTWRSMARFGERYEEGEGRRSWKEGSWLAWAPTEPPKSTADPLPFQKARWEGVHVLGVAADPGWLPPDLVAEADHCVDLPPLNGEGLASFARSLCGGAVIAHALPGQDADEYLRRVGGIVARDRATRPAKTLPSVSPRSAPDLGCLPGMDEATAWGRDLERDLSAYRRGDLPWSAIDKGVLLYGPPGTGKTSFARALARTCGVPLVIGSLAQWQSARFGHLGDLLAAMRATFTEARAAVPSILFVDEVDGFGDRETFSHSHRDYSVQVVNAFLELLDGVTAREGVIVVGACNHPHRLDPAIVRSGRLDRSIGIPLPGRAALGEILRVHLGADLPGTDLEKAATILLGGTGADCERHVRGARRRARQAGRPMEHEDLLGELGGAEDRTVAEIRLAAVHEAGHALAVLRLRPGTLVSVSIRGTARSGGMVMAAPLPGFCNWGELRDQLVVLLSGRAAEEEIIGVPSSGAGGGPSSDVAKATMLAAVGIAELALDEDRSGLVWSGVSDQSLSAKLAADPVLAGRVKELLAEAYGRAKHMVREGRAVVSALAEALEHRMVLDGDEAAAVAGGIVSDGTGWKRVVTRVPVSPEVQAERRLTMAAAAAKTRAVRLSLQAAWEAAPLGDIAPAVLPGTVACSPEEAEGSHGDRVSRSEGDG